MAALAPAAPPPPPPWIPEDDLLLKNAVEAGASLEALAKGAVRFSRKFTVRELRERWHSLLYDPVVSAQASSRMLELELPSANSPAASRVSKFGAARKESPRMPVKRKVESVRGLYYAMRKKFCRGMMCDSMDLGFIDSPEGGECFGFDGDPRARSCGFGDGNRSDLAAFVRKERCGEGDNAGNDIGPVAAKTLAEARDGENLSEMEGKKIPESTARFHAAEGISSPLPGMPLWKTMEDVLAPEMPIHAGIEHGGHSGEESRVNQTDTDGNGVSLPGPSVAHSGETLEEDRDTAISNNPTGISGCDFAISDSLLNLENEGVPSFMDIDGKDAVDSTCYDNINSLVAGSPHDVKDDTPRVKELKPLDSVASLQLPAEAHPVKVEVVAECPVSVDGDLQTPSHAENNASSSISALNACAEQGDGEMVCFLNTEDSDIPCNDNVLSAKELASVRKNASLDVCQLSSSHAKQKNSSQELILIAKEDNVAQLLSPSHMAGQAILPVTSPAHQHVRSGVKCESPDITCPSVSSGQLSFPHGNPSHIGSARPPPTSARGGFLKADSLRACSARDIPLHAEESFPADESSLAEADLSTLNNEELESDDDIPHFSDIEAMILESDLCAYDSDSFIDREVSKYQNEDARKIMRLEQCAQSSTHRAIASRGALAVLYGHNSKHYIKKTEVMLGRATEEMDVDIDLRREGPANKISRRQIRGMAFMFEVNNKSVRQYVTNVAKRWHAKKFEFEISEEQIKRHGKHIKFNGPLKGFQEQKKAIAGSSSSL
ncbi:hypothetical protein Tsubulata_046965 [Turnera subulata]|uniref:Microspherule protein N-terminal domain-containing protein n=1 Tax=Turnera subulata TaxID=218843 RepID=A0A9Q0G2W7_9ROSI|nr:hypothetical protein Tsubulata_046965 [Turnera subulata]